MGQATLQTTHLTPRQQTIADIASDPAIDTITEVAKRAGITPTTAAEHLAKPQVKSAVQRARRKGRDKAKGVIDLAAQHIDSMVRQIDSITETDPLRAIAIADKLLDVRGKLLEQASKYQTNAQDAESARLSYQRRIAAAIRLGRIKGKAEQRLSPCPSCGGTVAEQVDEPQAIENAGVGDEGQA